MSTSDLAIIVLCAGQGKRMNTQKPKVLHKLCGKPLFAWSLDLAENLGALEIISVVGHEKEWVKSAIKNRYGDQIKISIQEEQLGTGHAVLKALECLSDKSSRVLVLYGDTPLLTQKSLESLCETQKKYNLHIALITATLQNPSGYGRILRDSENKIFKIIEEKDASDQEKKIKEINSGIYVFDVKFLRENINKISQNNNKKEYYLTDLIELSTRKETIKSNPKEILGVNDLEQLSMAEAIIRDKINLKWLSLGVSMQDPKTTYIDETVKLESNIYLEPGVILKGNCQIESGVRIGAYSILVDSVVKKNSNILSHSHIEKSFIGESCSIGPFARLRPDSNLSNQVKIGNFVEIKKSQISKNSKISHLSYIGDAEFGEFCNIGAGVITCNYDGKNKHKIKLANKVFVGSNSSLVAPLEIEENSYVAAGSVITKNIPKDSLGLSRARQENKIDWSKKNA